MEAKDRMQETGHMLLFWQGGRSRRVSLMYIVMLWLILGNLEEEESVETLDF